MSAGLTNITLEKQHPSKHYNSAPCPVVVYLVSLIVSLSPPPPLGGRGGRTVAPVTAHHMGANTRSLSPVEVRTHGSHKTEPKRPGRCHLYGYHGAHVHTQTRTHPHEPQSTYLLPRFSTAAQMLVCMVANENILSDLLFRTEFTLPPW